LITNVVQHTAGNAQLHVHCDGVIVAVQVRDLSTAHPHLQSLDP
jgi:hypothetical protein